MLVSIEADRKKVKLAEDTNLEQTSYATTVVLIKLNFIQPNEVHFNLKCILTEVQSRSERGLLLQCW